MNWLVIIFYVLLVDAIVANMLAFSNKQHWWQTHLKPLATHFPLARGWTLYYLLLVLFLGIILSKEHGIVLPF